MKTLYIFRDSYDARYILSVLDTKGAVDAVMLESGKQAKKKKIKRFFKGAAIFRYPFILLDIVSLIVYSAIMVRKMKIILGEYSYPVIKNVLRIEDINEEKCLSFAKKQNPDVIIIYGTGIVKKGFIDGVNVPILNIHTGILPKYRNVHSDFWAFKNKDYKQIGTSIIYLDAGVDTGDIALVRPLTVTENSSLAQIKVDNLKQIPEMVFSVLEQIKKGELTYTKQNNDSAHMYKSPTLLDLLSLIRR